MNGILIRVPAHFGLVGNEFVDHLAKDGLGHRAVDDTIGIALSRVQDGLGHRAVDDTIGIALSRVQATSMHHGLGEWRRRVVPTKHNYYTRISVSHNSHEPYSTNYRVKMLFWFYLPCEVAKYVLTCDVGANA